VGVWCHTSRCGERNSYCDPRYTLASGHPGLKVACPSCHASVGAVCIHLSRPLQVIKSIHPKRDILAYETLTDVVPGLMYPFHEGIHPVRPGWVVKDKTRKKDKLRSVRFRGPGEFDPRWWASTYDNRVWIAGRFANETKRSAATRGAIDRLAALAGEPRTLIIDEKEPEIVELP
jgi:hypothetical protein